MAAPPHSAEVAVLCRCVASLLHCRYEEEAAGAAGGMMAKFLAARAKQDSRPGQSQSKKPARTLRALRTFDPTSGGGSGGGGGGGGGGESDVLVCVLPADCPQARARLVKALRSPSAPYHLVLAADYTQVKADGELAGLLLRCPGALFVVPKAPTSSGQVLCCGKQNMNRDHAACPVYSPLPLYPVRVGAVLRRARARERRLVRGNQRRRDRGGEARPRGGRLDLQACADTGARRGAHRPHQPRLASRASLLQDGRAAAVPAAVGR